MRKKIIISLLILLAALPLTYGKSYNVILLETMDVPVVTIHSQAIQDQLDVLSEEKNITFHLEILKGQGSKEKCTELLKSYLEVKVPDFVLTVATLATQSAVELFKDSDVPVLFCVVMDPVGSGIVKEVGVPSETNVSGVVYTHQRDIKVEMVMRLFDQPFRDSGVKFGIISSDYPSAVGDVRMLNDISEIYENIEFISYQFPYKEIPRHLPGLLINFQRGIDEIKDKVDFLWEVGGPLAEIEVASQMLIDSGVPLILGSTPKSVELGALMSIAPDYQDTGLQIVEMINMIIQEDSVGSIPIAVPRKFDLYFNMKTAEELGLKVPSHMLMIAGDHIYR